MFCRHKNELIDKRSTNMLYPACAWEKIYLNCKSYAMQYYITGSIINGSNLHINYSFFRDHRYWIQFGVNESTCI